MWSTTLTKYNTDNIQKFLNDIDRYSIGMDEWFHRFATLHETNVNYPPYNLVKESSIDFKLEIALAGFKKEEISVTTEWDKLFVEASLSGEDENDYVYRGLARRSFKRSWTLSDDVEVRDVAFSDGLLTIKLKRVIPEHQKKKQYEIN